jgi:hypothetical protein
MQKTTRPAQLGQAGGAVVSGRNCNAETTVKILDSQRDHAARWVSRRHFLRLSVAAIVAAEIGIGGAR